MNRLAGIGVIFDMDGVLIDSYEPHYRSWELLGEEIGHHITEAQFASGFGKTSRDFIRHLFGPSHTDADIKRLDDRKESLYRDLIRTRVPLMPGAVQAIARMRSAGARVAVGSSGPPENVSLAVAALGGEAVFDAIVTGADVRRGKPDPQVFLLAAERIGLRPARCVVIEDAVAGVEAARAAGMAVVGLLGTHSHGALAHATKTIHALDELSVNLVAGLVTDAG